MTYFINRSLWKAITRMGYSLGKSNRKIVLVCDVIFGLIVLVVIALLYLMMLQVIVEMI